MSGSLRIQITSSSLMTITRSIWYSLKREQTSRKILSKKMKLSLLTSYLRESEATIDYNPCRFRMLNPAAYLSWWLVIKAEPAYTLVTWSLSPSSKCKSKKFCCRPKTGSLSLATITPTKSVLTKMMKSRSTRECSTLIYFHRAIFPSSYIPSQLRVEALSLI